VSIYAVFSINLACEFLSRSKPPVKPGRFIMLCTAKKFEASRQEMQDSSYRDADYVLTGVFEAVTDLPWYKRNRLGFLT
jgi:hypothetical protein